MTSQDTRVDMEYLQNFIEDLRSCIG